MLPTGATARWMVGRRLSYFQATVHGKRPGNADLHGSTVIFFRLGWISADECGSAFFPLGALVPCAKEKLRVWSRGRNRSAALSEPFGRIRLAPRLPSELYSGEPWGQAVLIMFGCDRWKILRHDVRGRKHDWPIGVGASKRRIYVADQINRCVVRVKPAFAPQHTVAVR